MGMNSELSVDDKVRHDEANALQVIAFLIRSAKEEVKQILSRTGDYRARVARDHLIDAEAKLDKLEFEIVSGMEAIKKCGNDGQ